jgi:hypothetical protein
MRFGSVLWRTQRAARLQCFEYLRQKSISLISRTEPGNFLLKRSTAFRDLVCWDAARSANRVRDLKPIHARPDPSGSSSVKARMSPLAAAIAESVRGSYQASSQSVIGACHGCIPSILNCMLNGSVIKPRSIFLAKKGSFSTRLEQTRPGS